MVPGDEVPTSTVAVCGYVPDVDGVGETGGEELTGGGVIVRDPCKLTADCLHDSDVKAAVPGEQ
jgi:hypothetical protein